MKAGPICPLRLGTFDSLNYWTDPVLMSSVRPMTAQEIDDIADQSRLDQGRFRQQSRKDKTRATINQPLRILQLAQLSK
jgi:hypothetical protein